MNTIKDDTYTGIYTTGEFNRRRASAVDSRIPHIPLLSSSLQEDEEEQDYSKYSVAMSCDWSEVRLLSHVTHSRFVSFGNAEASVGEFQSSN